MNRFSCFIFVICHKSSRNKISHAVCLEMRLNIACNVLTTLFILPFNTDGFLQSSVRKNLQIVTSDNYNRLEPLHVETSDSVSDSVVENVPDSVDEDEEKLNALLTLPRHASNENVNQILSATESALKYLKMESMNGLDTEEEIISPSDDTSSSFKENDPTDTYNGRVYANSYVDLGRVGKSQSSLISIMVYMILL